MAMYYDPETMKIILCKECKGSGRCLDDDKAPTENPCDFCNGRGRLVRKTTQESLKLDLFDLD